MKSLNQIQELFAGLYNLYFIKTSEIKSIGDIINGELQSITLNTGSDYTQIPFTQNSAGSDSKARVQKIAYLENSVELYLSGNNPDQVFQFSEMDADTYIIILHDRNNKLWVLGTPEMPLHFTDKYSTGKSMDQANGRKIKFQSNSTISIASFESLDKIEEYDPSTSGNFYISSTKETVTFRIRGTIDEVVVFTNDAGDTVQETLLGHELPALPNKDVYITIPATGNIYCMYGAEHIQWFEANTQSINILGNLDKFTALEVLYVQLNNITSIDLSNCGQLTMLNLANNINLNNIVFPVINILESVILQSCNLSTINMSAFFDNLKLLSIRDNSNLTFNSDFTEFKKLLALSANNLGLSQSDIDSIYTTFLTSWQTYARADETYTSKSVVTLGSAAPSASGLAAITTLEATYGYTITYE
jgi:hypothetical protein